MTALALFAELMANGVGMTPVPGGTVRYTANAGILTPDVLAQIRQHKDALYALVEAFEERAALAEHCGGLARAEAQRLAWANVQARFA